MLNYINGGKGMLSKVCEVGYAKKGMLMEAVLSYITLCKVGNILSYVKICEVL